MKKLFLLFTLVCLPLFIFAFDTSEKFSFVVQESPEGYQQYVGKSFFVRPAYGKKETWYKSKFSYSDLYKSSVFIITKVKVRNDFINGKHNKRITVVADEYGSNITIQFKCYEKDVPHTNELYPTISNMPVVFTEPFYKFRETMMGKTISHELVKDTYTITDVLMGPGTPVNDFDATPHVIVQNNRTSETMECPYSELNYRPFEYALSGKYNTSLVRVEKPDNTSKRYGDITTIHNDENNRYPYNDNVIAIKIAGNEKELDFYLKNISDHSLKIIWNEAAFVGLNGTTSKIMHKGTKFSDRNEDQPATTIIKDAILEDAILPTSNVYLTGYYGIGYYWDTYPILPLRYFGKIAGEIKLMLPIQIKDVINEYTFVFKVSYTFAHPELLDIQKVTNNIITPLTSNL